MQPHHESPAHAAWPRALVALHWATAFLVIAAFALVIGREFTETKPARQALLQAHRYIGLTIFLMLLVRLPLRIGTSAPDHDLAPLAKFVSKAGHGILYLLLAGIPLIGYALFAARTGHMDYFGINLPTFVERDRDLAETLEAAHEWAGWFLLAIAGLHASAALWHHYIRRDNVLQSMLPVVQKTN